MKSPDLTSRVMEKVVRFEKQRIRLWLIRFLLVMAGLGTIALILLGISAQKVAERQTWELLTLFQEDPEVIRSYWREVLEVFWQELPQQALFYTVVVVILLIGVIFLTRKKRQIIKTKIKSLGKNKEADMKRIWLIIVLVLVVGGAAGAVLLKSQPANLSLPRLESPLKLPPSSPTEGSGEAEVTSEKSSGEMFLTIEAPANGAVVTNARLALKGKTLPRAEVFANETEGVADKNGNFTLTVTLDEGENIIVVTAVDAFGNAAEKELSVTYDGSQ